MLRNLRLILAGTVASLALTASAGVAAAAPPHPVLGVVQAAATYAGIAPAELVTELRAGESLAQIATGHGKTVDGLKTALHNAVRAGLDKAVADGRITADTAKGVLARFDEHLSALVDRTGPPPRRARHHVLAAIARVSADYVGITRLGLVTEVRSGKSLAQVAMGHGKTIDGLKAALHDALKAHLDQAVAAGRISADQENEVLARFDGRLDDLVNRTRP